MRDLLLLAHRGGAKEAPENTIAAIEHTLASGADGIELDVRLSSEGEPVVFHDHDLRRLGGSRRRVDESGLHELVNVELGRSRAGFDGARIPTLGEALEAARGLSPIQLELKADADAATLARRVAREVENRALGGEVEITSFSRAAVEEARRVAPEIASGMVFETAPEDDAWTAFPILSLSKELARAGWARRGSERGLVVYVWTENDPAALDEWAALGVRGVITDRPARLAAARSGGGARSGRSA